MECTTWSNYAAVTARYLFVELLNQKQLSLDDEDVNVHRNCTTINDSIHQKTSDMCDNILAMAEFVDAKNNQPDDDSFVEFAYGDDGNDNYYIDEDDDVDDDEEDYDDDDEFDEDLGDEYDVVDFSFNCPIETVPKLSCDKKKKVHFNTKPIVHVLYTWNYAYRAARKGEWQTHACDRERFKMRIQRTALTINPILKREHRQKIYATRFAKLYDNDNDFSQNFSVINDGVKNLCSSEIEKSEETSNKIESKKPHQKKKRNKKRFCKMGNKHYF